MFRSMIRVAVLALVVATLVLASVPAAQASPLDRAASFRSAGWLDAALSWLTGLLHGTETPAPQPKTAAQENTVTVVPIGGYAPMSGSCLDPEGRPKPCF